MYIKQKLESLKIIELFIVNNLEIILLYIFVEHIYMYVYIFTFIIYSKSFQAGFSC